MPTTCQEGCRPTKWMRRKRVRLKKSIGYFSLPSAGAKVVAGDQIMTIQLQVPPALELRLRKEAAVRGEDVETVVVNALAERFGAETHNGPDKPRWSVQE